MRCVTEVCLAQQEAARRGVSHCIYSHRQPNSWACSRKGSLWKAKGPGGRRLRERTQTTQMSGNFGFRPPRICGRESHSQVEPPSRLRLGRRLRVTCKDTGRSRWRASASSSLQRRSPQPGGCTRSMPPWEAATSVVGLGREDCAPCCWQQQQHACREAAHMHGSRDTPSQMQFAMILRAIRNGSHGQRQGRCRGVEVL